MLRLSVFITITILGVIVALAMWAIKRQHARNCAQHPDEIARLLAIARSDTH
jgi:MFS transporter, LPLT family, lysophospholipid transporter